MPGKKTKGGKKQARFVIDCKDPVEDNVLVTQDFRDYLTSRIKVNGKAGNLGDDIKVNCDKNQVDVVGPPTFSKRYLKYLSKKYLAKEQLRDYLRVVASSKNAYTLRYYKMSGAEEE